MKIFTAILTFLVLAVPVLSMCGDHDSTDCVSSTQHIEILTNTTQPNTRSARKARFAPQAAALEARLDAGQPPCEVQFEYCQLSTWQWDGSNTMSFYVWDWYCNLIAVETNVPFIGDGGWIDLTSPVLEGPIRVYTNRNYLITPYWYFLGHVYGSKPWQVVFANDGLHRTGVFDCWPW